MAEAERACFVSALDQPVCCLGMCKHASECVSMVVSFSACLGQKSPFNIVWDGALLVLIFG